MIAQGSLPGNRSHLELMKPVLFTFCALLSAQAAFPQDGSSIVGEMTKHWQTSKALSLAVAEAMPADAYSFKATDGEMSFGEQMNHIALANGSYCSAAIGTSSPFGKPADASKATATKMLTAAYDYCIEGLSKLDDRGLQQKVTRGTTEVTKFELFWGGFTHAAHHRGQAEVYLRLKGITPPSYKF
jgi:uncharacterized damage-inducible protein DinB